MGGLRPDDGERHPDRAVIVLLAAIACHAPEEGSPAESADTRTTLPSDDTAPPEVPRPVLSTVPDAPDLDPAEGAVRVALTADVAAHTVGGVTYEGYAYNGTIPGPLLRARVGDVLTVDFRNDLLTSTTVHWHGVSAPADMDGVTWLLAPIPELSDFTYTLPLDRPGTFWYHPHVDVDHQVDLGLYGPIVVEDPADPPVEELVLVFDAWGEEEADAHGLSLPEDRRWTVNGLEDPVYRAPAGAQRRVRLVNAANTATLDLVWPGVQVVGGDQGLGGAEWGDRLLVAPGDRLELLWTVSETDVTTLPFTPAGGDGAWGAEVRLFSVETEGEASDAVALLPPEIAPSPDPPYTDLTYVFEGDTTGDSWRINGEAYPDVTVQTVAQDAPTVIEVRNLSATNHPFHLHGNPFEILSQDGVPPPRRTVADTVDVPIRGVVRVLLTPDNPGDWMLHCHLLAHEEGGMMTVLRVQAPEGAVPPGPSPPR